MPIPRKDSVRAKTNDALDINPTSALLRTLILARLKEADNYPSGLARELSQYGVPLDPAHASALMAQLQEDGLARSAWVFDVGTRPRRWYSCTERGRTECDSMVARTTKLYQQILTMLQP